MGQGRSDEQEAARGWERTALAALDEGGYRAGGARREVIGLLAEQGGCLDAESVNESLRRRGRRIGTASVYRALGLLSELGLLRKVALGDSPARFELVVPSGEHHHHIVCDRCGATRAFSDESLERAIERVSDRASFEVEAHEVTLHGICGRCRAEAA